MARINIYQKLETCPICRNVLNFEYNSQLYCSECKYSPDILQSELKVVPVSYRPNYQKPIAKRQTSIESYLRNYASICGFNLSHEEINNLVQEVLYIHKLKGHLSRGYDYHSAVIIYDKYKQIHKFPHRQFCRKLSLSLHKFNTSYLLYAQRQKQIQKTIKCEQQCEFKLSHQNIQEFIQLIYDDIIKSNSFIENGKYKIINKLTSKILDLYNKLVAAQFDFSEINIRQIQVYLLFLFFKAIQCKLTIKKYQFIIEDKLGLKMNSKIYSQLKKAYLKLINDDGTIATTRDQTSQDV